MHKNYKGWERAGDGWLRARTGVPMAHDVLIMYIYQLIIDYSGVSQVWKDGVSVKFFQRGPTLSARVLE